MLQAESIKSFVPGDLMMTTSFLGINLKKEMTELLGICGIEEKQYFLNFPTCGTELNYPQGCENRKYSG